MEITKSNNNSSKVVQQKGGFFQPQGSSTFFGVAQKKSFFSPTAQPKQKSDFNKSEGPEGLSYLPSLSKKRDGGAAADVNSPNQDKGALVPYQFRQTKTKKKQQKAASNKLPPLVQLQMEGAFGQDFSNINIRQNSSKAQKLGARAFAQGEELHFASGEYQPNTTNGQELIAHELGHIVQNRRQQVKPTGEAPDGTPINDDIKLEQEADQMAQKAVRYQVKETDIEQQSAPRNRSNVTQAKMVVQMNPIMGATYEDEGKETDGNETSDYQEGNNHTNEGASTNGEVDDNQSSGKTGGSKSRGGGKPKEEENGDGEGGEASTNDEKEGNSHTEGNHGTNEGSSTNGEVDDNQSSGKTGGSKSRGGSKPKEEENEDGEGGEASTNDEKEGAGTGTDDSSTGNANEGGDGDTGDVSGNGENTDASTGANGEGQGETNAGDSSDENTNNEGNATDQSSTGGENNTPNTDTKTTEAGAAGNYLREAAHPFFQKALDKIEALADQHQKTSPAHLKRQEAEQAVVPSTKEGQSKADAKRVQKVGNKPKPSTNKQKAKSDFDAKLKGSLPEKIKDVDEFKGSGKAKKIGKAAVDVVAVDKDSVIGTYGEMKDRPTPEHLNTNTVPLPSLEKATETPPLNLADNMIADLKPEHTDFSHYKKDVDDAMEKEGLTQEHLDEVNSGELLTLKEHRSEIETTANKAPEEIQQVRTAEITKMNESLSAEEAAERQDMQNQRNQELQNAQEQQVKAKSELEIKREQVSADINKIYENAQQQVSQKLDGLEKDSFKKFEQGQKNATQIFEQNVDNRIKAFKKERYTKKNGKFRTLKWLADCVFGINRFDEVKQILDEERTRFVNSINQLIDDITNHNEAVIKECRDIVENTRLQIATYVDGLPESLRSIGEAAEENIQKELDELEEQIAIQEQELQEKLATKKEEAIAAIDKAIEERKKKMDGLLAKCVNVLFNAALKYIRWALTLVGIDPEPIIDMITKIKDGIMTIMREPKVFFKNLGQAIGGGFKQFGSNAGQYLKDVVFQWLGKKVGVSGIKFPKKFDLKGILGLVTSALGISWSNIKGMFSEFLGGDFVSKVESGIDFVKGMMQDGPAHLKELGVEKIKEKLAEQIGQEKVDKIFMAVDLVKSIAKDGISAVVDFVKEQAADLKSIVSSKVGEIKANVIQEIKNFIKTKIIQEGIKQILSMVTPATGIAKAVQGIFKVIQFFREEKDALKDLFKTIGQALGLVFKGDPGGASALIFDGILKAIPILLSFIVKILNLDGVFKKVKEVIGSVREGVDKFLKKVVKWVSKIVKNVWEKIKEWFGKLKEKAKDKLSGKKKNEEEVPDYADPEKKAKVVAALDKLDEEQEQYVEGGKIRKKDAKQVVKTIKASEEGQIFSKLKVIKSEDGKRWDYLWAASPDNIHPGVGACGGLDSTVGTKGQADNNKSDIFKVQQAFCDNGFKITVDGKIGKETYSAINNFQILVLNQNPTCLISPDDTTWQALEANKGMAAISSKAWSIQAPVKMNGTNTKDIRVVQFLLVQRGYLDKGMKDVDGKALQRTHNAINKFQVDKFRGAKTGIIMPNDATWQMLVHGTSSTTDSNVTSSSSVGRDAENLQENVAMVENNLVLCHALKASDKVSDQYALGTSIPTEKLTPLINAISDFQTRYMGNANCNSGFLQVGDETYTALNDVADKDRNLQKATGMSNFEILEKVWHDPRSFIENSGLALKTSFNQFISGIIGGKDLQTYLFEWLSIELGGDIKPPKSWDAKGIVEMGMNALVDTFGLSPQGIESYIRAEINNDPLVDAALASVEVFKLVMTQGPMAAWDHIKTEITDLADSMTGLFFDELKAWLQQTLITKALTKVATLFIPGGNVLVLVDTIYDAFTTIRENAERFQSLFNTLTQSVTALANGDIDQAVAQITAVLKNTTAIAISFLAKFAGLNKITGRIKEALKKAEKQLKQIFEKIKKKVLEKVRVFTGKKGKNKEDDKKSNDDPNQPLNLNNLEDSFTADNKVGHKIYFEKQTDGTFELIIHSKKQTYQNFIRALKVPKDDQDKIQAQSELIKHIDDMDKALHDKYKEKDPTKLKNIDTKIRKLFKDIFRKTITLFRVSDSSVPVWGPKTRAGFGTSMIINYLSRKAYSGAAGSGTGQLQTPVYEKLEKRKSTVKSYYNRGHLLSELLNGPGIWENMSPLTHSANIKHEAQVESHLKTGTQEGKTFYYKVKAIYGRSIDTTLLSQLDNLGIADEEKDILRSIIESEQYVPKKFIVTAKELDPETGKAKVGGISYKNKPIDNDIKESKISDYNFKSSPVPKTLLINAQTDINHLKHYFKSPSSKIPENIIKFFNHRYFRQDYWDKKTNKEKCEYLANSIKSLQEDRLKELLVQGKIKF